MLVNFFIPPVLVHMFDNYNFDHMSDYWRISDSLFIVLRELMMMKRYIASNINSHSHQYIFRQIWIVVVKHLLFKVEEVILENRRKRKLSYSGSWALVDCIVDDDSATLLQTPRLC